MSQTEPVQITLPAEVAQIIEKHLAAGTFSSPADVLVAGMTQWNAWQDSEAEHDMPYSDDEIRTMVEAAINNPRPPIPAEEVFSNLRAKYCTIG